MAISLKLSPVQAQEVVRWRRERDGHIPDWVAELRASASSPVDEIIKQISDDFTSAWYSNHEMKSGNGKKLSGRRKDELEALLAVDFKTNIDKLPSRALIETDVWRYLAAVEMFDFISWRDGVNCKMTSFGAVNDNPGFDCVPLRMYLRIRILQDGMVEGDDLNELATFQGTDFWRSHVLRVKLGQEPRLIRRFMSAISDDQLNTNEVRRLAKILSRFSTNLTLESMSDDGLDELVSRSVSLLESQLVDDLTTEGTERDDDD